MNELFLNNYADNTLQSGRESKQLGKMMLQLRPKFHVKKDPRMQMVLEALIQGPHTKLKFLQALNLNSYIKKKTKAKTSDKFKIKPLTPKTCYRIFYSSYSNT